jgi:Zn-dependent protease with chaperone function
MSVVASLQLFLLAALLFALFASAVASVAVPLVHRMTRDAAPDARHRALLLLATFPALFILVALVATVAPSVLGLVWPAHDHCLVHGSGHAHLCFVHLPQHTGGLASWILLAAALGFFGTRAALGVARVRGAARMCARLLSHGVEAPALSAKVLPTPSPLCVSVGLLQPETVLSEGFLKGVDAGQLEAVLLHERAHAARRDALSRTIASATTILMLPSARERLLRELELSAEQSCDETAAVAIGDRLAMAEVILKVERLLGDVPHGMAPLAVPFGGTTIPLRVAALLAPPKTDRQTFLVKSLAVCALVAVVGASDHLHHLTETVVGILVH